MADVVGPLGFIRQMIGQAVSPTEGLRQYRQAGGAIRTQRWYAAFGQLQAEAATRPRVQAAPLNRVPAAPEINRVGSRRPGAFLYRGAVLSFDRQTGVMLTKYASLRTRRLLTYRAAIDIMAGQLGDREDEYGLSVVGAYVTSVNELVPVEQTGGLFNA